MCNKTLCMPMVTVLLLTYHTEMYLQQALDSVWAQTFRDFEILIVNDDDSKDMTRILQNNACDQLRVISGRNQGLADALNLGIEQARGKYIARFDADDLMVPERLEKQVAFMEENKDVAVCGGWQQYFGLSTFLHAPSADAEQCKANLLFRCDLCHSTLMLRRDFFAQNQLRYSSDYAAEDFELWTRVLDYGKITNLPMVLGLYRETGRSITDNKKEQLIVENSEIVAKTLRRNLGINLSAEQKKYFAGWINPFYTRKTVYIGDARENVWEDLKQLMQNIISANGEKQYYDKLALCRAIRSEWLTLRYNLSFQVSESIEGDDVFEDLSELKVLYLKILSFSRNYRGIKRKICKIRSILRK